MRDSGLPLCRKQDSKPGTGVRHVVSVFLSHLGLGVSTVKTICFITFVQVLLLGSCAKLGIGDAKFGVSCFGASRSGPYGL